MTTRRFGPSLAALLLTAVTAACAGSPPAQPLDPPQTAGSIRAQLDNLDQRITGTPADRSAAAYSQYVAYQMPLRDCMARNGLTYVVPQYADAFGSWAADRPLDTIDLLVPIDAEQQARGLYLAEDLMSAAALAPVDNPAYAALDAAGKRAFADQVTKGTPHADVYMDADFPAGALALADKLTAALGAPLDIPPLRALAAGYPACMDKSGYPQVTSRLDLKGQIQTKMFTPLWADATTQRLTADDPRLVAARAAERAAAAADAACRAEAYPLAMQMIGPVVAAFTLEHADALAELDRAWAEARAKADIDRKIFEAGTPRSSDRPHRITG